MSICLKYTSTAYTTLYHYVSDVRKYALLEMTLFRCFNIFLYFTLYYNQGYLFFCVAYVLRTTP